MVKRLTAPEARPVRDLTEPRLIGGDLMVRRPGLGALRLGNDSWSGPTDMSAAVKVLRRAVDLGVDLIDTADSYGLGANEELIAAALHPYPENLVIATKVGQTQAKNGAWAPLGRPDYLRQQVELSLRRLRLERLDLLQLHRIDPLITLADQVGVLDEMRSEGKIRHVGLCKVTPDEVRAAMLTVPIVSVQNPYNLGYRAFEDSVEHCASSDLAMICWGPLGGEAPIKTRALTDVARECGVTTAEVALAWLLHRSLACIPIPGTRSLEHLADNMRAIDLVLSDDQFQRLSDAGQP